MLVGYARVSTDGQNLDREFDTLKARGQNDGTKIEDIVKETGLSRSTVNRILK